MKKKYKLYKINQIPKTIFPVAFIDFQKILQYQFCVLQCIS